MPPSPPRHPAAPRARRLATRTVTAALALVLVLAAACSDDDPSAEPAGDDVTTTTTADDDAADPADGPAAQLTELTGGDGVFVGAPAPYEPDPGYVQQEFAAAGTAASYVVEGEVTGDGQLALAPGEEADYTTRIVVRRPEDPDDFSGTVVVEWMNVSGGVDADPEFTSLREELVRQGHAWVGVSAQLIGVEGGPVRVEVDDVPGSEAAGQGLKKIDPERYGGLAHPGDAFANDIFTQIGRAIRAGDALGDLEPQAVVAAGESQSAFALVTYINGVHPLTGVYDGYFVHSRGASGFPVLSPGEDSADIATAISGTPTTFRTDLDVPVFQVQAENDVVGIFGSYRVRQPESDTFRLWEIAGTAHADVHLMGESTAAVIDCGAPINDGPMHVVVKAAFRHFVDWVVEGTPPPDSVWLEVVEGEPAEVERDEHGIAVGGVRTPPVDVPVQVLSGVAGPNPEPICLLSGSTLPIPDDQLAELYPSVDDYQQQYDAAVDAAIEAGYVLADDRAAIEGYAKPDLIPG